MSLFACRTGVFSWEWAKRTLVMAYALTDNWISMALIATCAWALSCVIDVCFVGNGVYRKPADGPFVAGLFCLVPALIAATALDLEGITAEVVVVAVISAVAFLLHMHLYFMALFSLNDAVNAEIFNTLCVVAVPIFAFLFLGERLGARNYAAIAVAAAGILVLVRLQAGRMSSRTIRYLVASVGAVSLMMVSQAWRLERAPYATVVFLFSAAAFLLVVMLLAVRQRERVRVTQMCRRFGAVFVMLQLLEIGAVIASQRATDVGPSVSLVALVECSLPVFVMIFSWLVAVTARRWHASGTTRLQSALAMQITVAPSKLISMLMIIFAIFLVQT